MKTTFHKNTVLGFLDYAITEQIPFSVVLENKNGKYTTITDKEYESFDIMNWTLEVSEVDYENESFNTTLVFGESDTLDVNIDVIDIVVLMLIENNQKIQVYTRFFSNDVQPVQKVEDEKIIDTTEFERKNKEGIEHSMSKLTLCKLGE